MITNTILIIGSISIILTSVQKFLYPTQVNYNGMLVFAIIGTVVNLIAASITHGGNSLNQKAVNLHMLEDVLGWVIVLIGAIIIKFTHLYFIDPLLSLFASVFILYHAIKSLNSVINIFLEKTPNHINIRDIKNEILNINSVIDLHDLHVWSLDGIENYATVHIVTNSQTDEVLNLIKEIFLNVNITNLTVQFENDENNCLNKHNVAGVHNE